MTTSRTKRLRIYLLSGMVTWALLTAIAGSEKGGLAIRTFVQSLIEGLNVVNPFYIFTNFYEGFIGEGDVPDPPKRFGEGFGLKPDLGVSAKPSEPAWPRFGEGFGLKPDLGRSPLDPNRPRIQLSDPKMKLLDKVGAGLTRTYRAIRNCGWPGAMPVILSGALLLVSLQPWEKNGPDYAVLHPANFCFLLLVAALTSWVLQLVLIGILKVFGAVLTLIAAYSFHIAAIEAARGWLDTAKKAREIVTLASTEEPPKPG
jgi:hypothetical protein